jgi:hypothetical protein
MRMFLIPDGRARRGGNAFPEAVRWDKSEKEDSEYRSVGGSECGGRGGESGQILESPFANLVNIHRPEK